MSQFSAVSKRLEMDEISWQEGGGKLARERCACLWADAACRRDLHAMRSLRRYIVWMQARALAKKSHPIGRQEWLAWLQLRCSLVVRRNRF